MSNTVNLAFTISFFSPVLWHLGYAYNSIRGFKKLREFAIRDHISTWDRIPNEYGKSQI